jgi:hypothetical protein
MAAGEAAAQEMAGRLTADSINRELSKAGLPTATVLEAATASNTGTGAVAAATAEASSSSFFSTPVLVGGILGIMFLAGIVACLCRWKCKNDVVLSHDTQIPVTLEMGTLATSVNESPVYDALGVSSALESQQGRIKQLEDMIASMAEKAGERKRERDEAGDGRSAEAGTDAEEWGREEDADMCVEGGQAVKRD